MDTKGIMLRVGEYRKTAAGAEKNIVDFIVGHPDEVVGMSIRDLAEATFTSPATVVRFSQHMGCSGYKEFQRCFVYELAINQRSTGSAFADITPEDSTTDVMRKVTRKNITSLETTRQILDAENVDACVDLMMSAGTIDLFGIGASLLVAKDLQLKLLRVDKRCNLCDDWNAQLLYARNMEPSDLAIVMSYSGLTQEMVTCASVARDNGAKVIAVTRGDTDSKLAAEADFVLGVAASESAIRSGAGASRICQLDVVDILYATYVNRDYERCMEGFRKNFISKEENSEQ